MIPTSAYEEPTTLQPYEVAENEVNPFTCSHEETVEVADGPSRSGRVTVWEECALCGTTTSGASRDSVV